MGGEKTLSIYEENGKIYKFLQSFYWSKMQVLPHIRCFLLGNICYVILY